MATPETRTNDWAIDATDAIVRTVATVRDKTVEPIQSGTRIAVFGMVAALIALPALILATIGAFRGLVVIYQGYVYLAWLTLGGIFVVAGWFLWTKRTP